MTEQGIEQGAQAQLLERMQEWKKTFESQDVDGMMSYYTGDTFTAFDLMPPIQFRGKDHWRRNWVTFFGAFEGAPKLEFADLEVHASGDLAVVRLLARLIGTMDGDEIDAWVRQTNCFRRTDGVWLMFHDHVSFPTDFATGRSLMELSPDKPVG
jgi:ketosteroid isomerase-like protein